VLETGWNGRLRVQLKGGAVLSLEPLAKLKVEQHDERTQQTSLELQAGVVRLQVGRLSRPDSKFDVRTNTTVVGILEAADYVVDASNPVSTEVSVSSGKLAVAGSGRPTTVSAGQTVRIGPDGRPHDIAEDNAKSASEAPKPVPGGVFRVGGGVSAPQLISRVEPQYTVEACAAHIQGTVILYSVINADGTVRDLRVIRALDPGLDQNALEAVRQWRFKPGMKDGQPVAVAASIEVTFRLGDFEF
jgi:TonB family protein